MVHASPCYLGSCSVDERIAPEKSSGSPALAILFRIGRKANGRPKPPVSFKLRRRFDALLIRLLLVAVVLELFLANGLLDFFRRQGG